MTTAAARRKKRSSRNLPAATSALRSRLQAAMTRTSTRRSVRPPTRRTFRLSRARSRRGWRSSGSSAISSRKSVPPCARSKAPEWAVTAPGEGAALVAQQLALYEVRRHRTAVEDDERPIGSRALIVEHVREDVLPGAGLPDEGDGDVGLRKSSEDVEDFVHRGGARRELSEFAHRRQVPSPNGVGRHLNSWRDPAPARRAPVVAGLTFPVRSMAQDRRSGRLLTRTPPLSGVRDLHGSTPVRASDEQACARQMDLYSISERLDATSPKHSRPGCTRPGNATFQPQSAARKARQNPRDIPFSSRGSRLYQRQPFPNVKLRRHDDTLASPGRHGLHAIVMNPPKVGRRRPKIGGPAPQCAARARRPHRADTRISSP